MKKLGVVDEKTATCALCPKHATTYVRGEPRCDGHASTDDHRTSAVKTAEDTSGDNQSDA